MKVRDVIKKLEEMDLDEEIITKGNHVVENYFDDTMISVEHENFIISKHMDILINRVNKLQAEYLGKYIELPEALVIGIKHFDELCTDQSTRDRMTNAKYNYKDYQLAKLGGFFLWWEAGMENKEPYFIDRIELENRIDRTLLDLELDEKTRVEKKKKRKIP